MGSIFKHIGSWTALILLGVFYLALGPGQDVQQQYSPQQLTSQCQKAPTFSQWSSTDFSKPDQLGNPQSASSDTTASSNCQSQNIPFYQSPESQFPFPVLLTQIPRNNARVASQLFDNRISDPPQYR